MSQKFYAFKPDYAVKPGNTIEETRLAMNLTKKELAERLGISTMSLDRIIVAAQPITAETANSLELVTGIEASFWNALEARYREHLVRAEQRKKLQETAEKFCAYPVAELSQRGFIPRKGKISDRMIALLAFFGVANLEALGQIEDQTLNAMAARSSEAFLSDRKAVFAWYRMAELQARKIECKPFDVSTFRNSLKGIKTLTANTGKEPLDALLVKATTLLASTGVALVFVKALPRAALNGATAWLTPTKAMIALTLRGNRDDKIWFSLFHEAYHILDDRKRLVFVSADECANSPNEQQAENFASNQLVPSALNEKIRKCVSLSEINGIASELGIAPGIVAGRYEYLSKMWKMFNGAFTYRKWQPGQWCLRGGRPT